MAATRPSSGELNLASSSRERLLLSAKRLFAEHGYENTSTASIARTAGTSESQLVKHFGSKEGLLEAIFEWGWQHINEAIGDALQIEPPRQRILKLLEIIHESLNRDEEMKELMLLESRRIRREARGREMVLISDSYRKLTSVIDHALSQMKERGEIDPEVNLLAVRSAISGMFEGMIRDQLLSQREPHPTHFTPAEVLLVFERLLTCLGPSPKPRGPSSGPA